MEFCLLFCLAMFDFFRIASRESKMLYIDILFESNATRRMVAARLPPHDGGAQCSTLLKCMCFCFTPCSILQVGFPFCWTNFGHLQSSTG